MPRAIRLLFLLPGLVVAPATRASADEPVKPIRALLITGGCCHDYTKQKKILSEGISARAPVVWTIVQQGGTTTNTKLPVYENPDWAKGFDIVVHNECFSDIPDPAWTQRILRPHKEGTPAVVIHCAMHGYRDKTDEWFKFLGVTSHRHGATYPFKVVNLAKDNPIMAGFGDSWQTAAGELYLISKVWDTATPLAHARSRDTNKDEVCIWTNAYGKTRVFGTTVGHHNEEMSDPVFLNYVTRGLLWAVGKLDDQHLKAADAKPAGLVPENLALGKPATASSTQNKVRGPEAANDGDPDSRWCPADENVGHWWQVDLGKPEDLTGCRITWESGDVGYRYKVEGSADGKAWSLLSDQTGTDARDQERSHRFVGKGVRYVRLTATGLESGHWASAFEIEVFGTKLVPAADGSLASSSNRAASERGILRGVSAPEGFQVSVFAAPPDVRYPTCLATTPNGEVYVGIDENGSIDAKGGRGRVLRCLDDDGDGKADRFNVFATMDSPRGLIVDGKTLYVLHPPDLTAYHDDNGDGVADRSEDLVKGIGFDLKFRGADHTTNGIRLGIDGWIYVAVGDYGFLKAQGKDGGPLQFRGGGVVRVRPDGTGLEIYSRGQRNIYDVAIDPYMNIFTRDNTNDGGGWDVRLSQIIPTGQYGYPSLFTRFADETVRPLADYGGGSPTGSLYLQDPAFPKGFDDTLYTCEWGRNAVFRHPLEPKGAGFSAKQEAFLEMPRPTDMDIDGRSRLYVSSWRGGGYTYDRPDVGYVIRVTPPAGTSAPFPDLAKATDSALLDALAAPGQVLRLAAQREILRRGAKPAFAQGLETLAGSERPLSARVAALFTLGLLQRDATDALLRLARRNDLREFALRALADRPSDRSSLASTPFVDALRDPNPRVRLQAVVGLGRLGRGESASAIVPLSVDDDPLVAHAAINVLVALHATDPCLKALDPTTPKLIPGAVRVLQRLHDSHTVEGLIGKLASKGDDALRRAVLKALCRLYYREADWDGKWWTTRPDTTGPYYQPVAWDETETIGRTLRAALADSDDATARWLLVELIKHGIDFKESTARAMALSVDDPALRSVAVDMVASRASLTPDALRFLGSVATSEKAEAALRAKSLRGLLRHIDQPGVLDAAIPVFAAIHAQEAPPSDSLGVLNDFLSDGRQAKSPGPFLKLAADPSPDRSALGFAALLRAETNPRLPSSVRPELRRTIDRAWDDPALAARLLRAVARTRNPAYALQVRAHLADASPEVRHAAEVAARELNLVSQTNAKDAIAKLPYDQVVSKVQGIKGDRALGASIFERQGCIACHTVTPGEAPKGPSLLGISARYNRAELTESILKPSAKISQGFETQRFATTSGQTLEGFVVRESGDEVELRNSTGAVTVLPKKEIDERGKTEASVMPNGLADPLSIPELAALLSYLESLKAN